MKLLLPLIFLLAGTGAGVGAGIMLKPAAPEEDHADADEGCAPERAHSAELEIPQETNEVALPTNMEFAQLNDQFVVPVIEDEKIAAMVVVTLSIAVPTGGTDGVYAVEPRLRDGLLQAMFNHANVGGFSGNFTKNSNMRSLRDDLLRSARQILGQDALDVLVVDLVRQDV